MSQLADLIWWLRPESSVNQKMAEHFFVFSNTNLENFLFNDINNDGGVLTTFEDCKLVNHEMLNPILHCNSVRSWILLQGLPQRIACPEGPR